MILFFIISKTGLTFLIRVKYPHLLFAVLPLVSKGFCIYFSYEVRTVLCFPLHNCMDASSYQPLHYFFLLFLFITINFRNMII